MLIGERQTPVGIGEDECCVTIEGQTIIHLYQILPTPERSSNVTRSYENQLMITREELNWTCQDSNKQNYWGNTE
tara:strand:+ start:228 stop:452 length:225 start_codon:yes stop_codon:yes gene_type:complete